ncbi:MAG: thiamine-phosphate kinase [Cyanobacteria bacterium P01_C01_bin.69]
MIVPADLNQPSNTIAQLGELALIEKLKPFCAAGSIGDDAALIKVQAEHKLVVTTDMLTENVHFSSRTTPPYTVGWRAVTANLADIAAMGAMPLGITVGLGLPGHTPMNWVEELYRGMSECLDMYGGAIVGGDLCRALQQTVSITATGEVRPHQVIRRDSATPGMTVIVTGPHGASRAGLALLLEEFDLEGKQPNELQPSELQPNELLSHAKAWIRAHQMPVPRFDALKDLRRIIGKANPEAYPTITGMDSSDGLANALLLISSCSGVGIDIVRSDIPLPMGLQAAVGAETALKWGLYGGEDFELVMCLPPAIADAFTKTRFATAIGITTASGTVRLLATENSTTGQTITHNSYQHF